MRLFDPGLPPPQTSSGPDGLRPGQSCRKCAAWLGRRHDPACPWAEQRDGHVVNGHTVEWPGLPGDDLERGVP